MTDDVSLLQPVDSSEIAGRLRFSLDEPTVIPPAGRAEIEEAIRLERRRQRSAGLEVTGRNMPDIHAMVRRVCDRLLIDVEPLVVVRSNPEPNACVYPGDDRPMVVLHSGLVSLLGLDELSAVVAHEFGHALLGHVSPMSNASAPGPFALARSRAHEVSADRIGLFGADSPEAALRSEIRITCGLDDRHLAIDLPMMVAEAHGLMIECERGEGEFHETHPEYPFRLWAQWRFLSSDVFRGLTGESGGDPIAEVEGEIESHFHALAGGGAFVFASDILHEAVAWLGALIVAEDGVVDETEREVLVQLVGTIWADDVATFAERHGLEAVKRRAMERVEALRHASAGERGRVRQAIERFEHRTGAISRCNEIRSLVDDAWATHRT